MRALLWVVAVLLLWPSALRAQEGELDRARRELRERLEKARADLEARAEQLRRDLAKGKAELDRQVAEAKARLHALEGDYRVTYGDPVFRVSGLKAEGSETQQGTRSGTLPTLDRMQAPEALRPLVDAYNQGIQALRDQIYASAPPVVTVTYPEPINVLIPKLRLISWRGDPARERALDCVSNQQGSAFVVVGDLHAGGREVAPGAGLFGLQLASMTGTLEPSGRGAGRLARAYVIAAGAQDKGLAVVSLSVEVDFTLERQAGTWTPSTASAAPAPTAPATEAERELQKEMAELAVAPQDSVEKQLDATLARKEKERKAQEQLQATLARYEGDWLATPGEVRAVGGLPAWAAAVAEMKTQMLAAAPERLTLALVPPLRLLPRIKAIAKRGEQSKVREIPSLAGQGHVRFAFDGDLGDVRRAGTGAMVFDVVFTAVEVDLGPDGTGTAKLVRRYARRGGKGAVQVELPLALKH